MPLWSRFDPVLAFPHLVGHLFVLALEPSGSWRVRLVGSSLRGALMGGAGKLLEEIYPAHVMQIFTPNLAALVNDRRPLQIEQASAYDRVLHSLGVALPFHQGDFLVTRVVSATFYLDDFHPAGPLQALRSEVAAHARDLVQ